MIKERKAKGVKVDQVENKKILELIKAKLSPLHTKIKMLPQIKKAETYTNGFCKKQKSPTQVFLMTKMIQKGVGNYPRISQQRSNSFLQKIKKHIAQQKKKNQVTTYEKADLDPFIQLFSRQNNIYDCDKKINTQLIKIESMQTHLQQLDSLQNLTQITYYEANTHSQFSPQQVSLMNAKLRKKTNHKKMIDLHKIR